MSKIKKLLDLVKHIHDEIVPIDEEHTDTWQSCELSEAIREAKAEHEQLTACINALTPSSFRDIHVYNELKRLV